MRDCYGSLRERSEGSRKAQSIPRRTKLVLAPTAGMVAESDKCESIRHRAIS